MQIINVRERPEYRDCAIAYYQKLWSNEQSRMVYEDAITHCIGAEAPLPNFYLLLDGDKLVGTTSLLANDFISRNDLYPWICAVFIEEAYRGRALGSRLLYRATRDAGAMGFPHVYLCTDHIGYYEKYGFRPIGTGYHPWGETSRIYRRDTADPTLDKLETPRLVLRRYCPEDWEGLHRMLCDPRVVEYEPYGVHTEEESRKAALERCGLDSFWAVCLRESGEFIGSLYFDRRDFGSWELGYVFRHSMQGKGYATEAARALLDRGFREWGVRRVTALCNPENAASWRLMERLGMRREGHLLKNIYFGGDENGLPLWQDTYEYALLAEEWLL